MTSTDIKKINEKAQRLGMDLLIIKSRAANKRFAALLPNKKRVNFGDPNATTYFDGADETKRKSYMARHSKIKTKDGKLAYKIPYTASWLAYNLLWT